MSIIHLKSSLSLTLVGILLNRTSVKVIDKLSSTAVDFASCACLGINLQHLVEIKY